MDTRTNILWYAVPQLLSRGLTFLLLPLYTRALSPGDFGLVAVALAVSGVIQLVVAPGMEGIYLRFGYRANELGAPGGRKLGTILYIHLTLLLVSLSALYALGPVIRGYLIPGVPALFYDVVLASTGLASFESPLRAAWRANHRAGRVTALQTAYALLAAAVTVLGLFVWRWGPISILLGGLVADTVLLPLLLGPIVAGFKAGCDPTMTRLIAPMVAAVIPEAAATWALCGLERIFLNHVRGPEAVGLYAAAYQVGAGLMAAALIFNKEWQPVILDCTLQASPRPEVLERLWDGSVRLFLFFGAAIAVLAGPIAHVLLGPTFAASASLIPVVAMIGVIRVPTLLLSQACWVLRKSSALAWLNIAAVTVFIGANLLLIPRYGAAGAAWAGVLGYGTYCAGLLAQPWQLFRFSPHTFGTSGVLAAIVLVTTTIVQPGTIVAAALACGLTIFLIREAWSFWKFLGTIPMGSLVSG